MKKTAGKATAGKTAADKAQSGRTHNCLILFLTFLKIGAFTFGGGYAMIPLIEHEIVNRRHYASEDDVLEIVAIAESTPGPIAINAATFIGYRVAGIAGSFAATFGVVLPSFFIILIISFFLRSFESVRIVKYAFAGVRAAVLALIIRALATMYKTCPKSLFSYILMAAAFLAVAFLGANVLLVILFSGAAGVFWTVFSAKKGGKIT
ncbi:MAG TPA: chromate transporter [Lachnospiraceae bacterium]|nr:chromate transporter [Lachnospiraceae bacterium]